MDEERYGSADLNDSLTPSEKNVANFGCLMRPR